MTRGRDRSIRKGLYLGLISGTSMDGVDAAVVELGPRACTMLHASSVPYPKDLRERLLEAVLSDRPLSVHALATLHIETGLHFSNVANRLLEDGSIERASVIAIGSHGQTLRHSPSGTFPYSWQLGDPATIAARCGIPTVADFRSIDLAYGGEGAPLVPAFHAFAFRDDAEDRAIVNIGGIANITFLPGRSRGEITGYDTGPGNCLLDEWYASHADHGRYDEGGRWASSGRVSAPLLESFLAEPYFSRSPPKSTGRETFNLSFIQRHLDNPAVHALSPEDVQATLLELTARTIADAISSNVRCRPARVFVCGGGARNDALLDALRRHLPGIGVSSSATVGIDPDLVEACAFAWLAAMRIARIPVLLTSAAPSRALILGAVYEPTGIRSE